MGQSLSMTVESAPSAQDNQFILDRLTEFNLQHAEADHHQHLSVFLRTEDGTILAGLVGDTYWGWLYISLFWVHASLRGHGYGRKLLEAAEAEARRRGCHHAHLDTMDWQALGFYQKHGYAVFGVLDDLPKGHHRYFLHKGL